MTANFWNAHEFWDLCIFVHDDVSISDW
uniref:Uncharacterized protein n=1 Tax=Arundo donax TaxID=35708 RepID=A0A0A9DC43_ARUDO